MRAVADIAKTRLGVFPPAELQQAPIFGGVRTSNGGSIGPARCCPTGSLTQVLTSYEITKMLFQSGVLRLASPIEF
jgi:hypothetical protein